MNEQSPDRVGPGVRWFVFGGFPMIAMALLACCYESLVRVVGERPAPYVGLGIAAVVWIGSLVVYDYIPKRLILPIGVVGWIVTLSVGYWFLNHGPHSF
jgi:hypothetical protein